MTVSQHSGSGSVADLGSSPWDSQHSEHDYRVTDIEGRIPEQLRGVLYRIGPGRLDVAGHPVDHIFDGDGMISRVEFSDEGVRFRNRYVRTRSFDTGNRVGRPPRGFGTQRPGGALANVLRFPANMSNTNVLRHGDHLYSLWEGGRPYRLDPDTLETLGCESFGGALTRLGAFSAHPKTDPRTREVFNFGLDFFPRPMIRCYRISAASAFSEVRTFPIPRLAFVHDFALTERHLVFVIDPIVVRRPVPVILGLRPFDRALSYVPELGTTVVLVPRDGGEPVRIEHDALFHFHVNNAYEDGGDTVVDLVAHDSSAGWDGWNGHLHDYRGTPGPAFGGQLRRLRVTSRRGRVTEETLADAGCEFPQLDQRRATTAHRHSYVASASVTGGNPDSVATIDHETGAIRSFVVGDGNTVCEPLFAASSPTAAEGDGWLLTIEHQAEQRRSRVLVLPADRPDLGPVAAIGLRHHVPMTFHGAFEARAQGR
ncbi:carotenoid oxygenase family protein [Rhodococcus gannanensis]|uniref:Dioxygenase n=1 Tax=Rhodococcus gannanensis TaxID=1960308 RepID=A0ABW4P6S5_9NOCA